MSTPLSGHWRAQRERGGRLPLAAGAWLARHCGRPLGRALLALVAVYFVLAAPAARRASLEFLERALARRAGVPDALRHFFTFATTLLDRIHFAAGRLDRYRISVSGEQLLWNALQQGRGCLLLGSHLGSFELLGMAGSLGPKLRINMLMHVDRASNFHRVAFAARASRAAPPYSIIPLGTPGSMLRASECLARGEIVGLLADRVYGDEATAAVPFLGRAARFSLSPWRLARLTGAPLIMAFGIFEGGRDYAIRFERIDARAKRFDAPVGCMEAPAPGTDADRSASGTPQPLLAYVARLEDEARRHPYNWFNFYGFWDA